MSTTETFDLDSIASDLEASQKKLPIDQQVRADIDAGNGLIVHPDAQKFPLMAEVDADGYAALKEDVAGQGEVLESIKVDTQGVLLDGRNRIRAINDLAAEGVKVIYRVDVISPSDKRNWIVSTNLHRRHLDPSQRAMIASQMAEDTGVQLKDAAKDLGVSERSAKRANVVTKKGTETQKKDVRDGKKTVGTTVKEITGQKQGSKTKGEYQDEVKKPAKVPAKPTKPAPAKKEKAAATRAKKPKGIADDEFNALKEQIRKCSNAQITTLFAFVRAQHKAVQQFKEG